MGSRIRPQLMLAALASVLPAASALGDDNTSQITQDGETHSGAIVQTGNRNIAGNDANDIEQRGVDNVLTLTQTGDDNTVGLLGAGLYQEGTASGDDSPSNIATITQDSDGNVIGELVQVTLGAHATTGNTLTVTEQLDGGNTIRFIRQTVADGASSNEADVTLTGARNWIERITQLATSSDGTNTIKLTITGAYNGINTGLDGVGDLLALALSAGATPGEITQGSASTGGAGNSVILDITGNSNQFGIAQLGVDNSIGTRNINGNSNSFGVVQIGSHNQVSPGAIVGDSNDLGIRQDGDTNVADLLMLGDSSDNDVGIGQQGDGNHAKVEIGGLPPSNLHGDGNVVGVSQKGTGHEAAVDIAGADNTVLAVQFNVGELTTPGNTLSVSITGNANNAVTAGGFLAPALAVASVAPKLTGAQLFAPGGALVHVPSSPPYLQPGMLVQIGEDNAIDIEVGGNRPSGSNLFAVMQQGNGSVVTARVDGSYNQFVVLQMGSDDVASVVQDGDRNIAAISQ